MPRASACVRCMDGNLAKSCVEIPISLAWERERSPCMLEVHMHLITMLDSQLLSEILL